jgi:hypothetical protein
LSFFLFFFFATFSLELSPLLRMHYVGKVRQRKRKNENESVRSFVRLFVSQPCTLRWIICLFKSVSKWFKEIALNPSIWKVEYQMKTLMGFKSTPDFHYSSEWNIITFIENVRLFQKNFFVKCIISKKCFWQEMKIYFNFFIVFPSILFNHSAKRTLPLKWCNDILMVPDNEKISSFSFGIDSTKHVKFNKSYLCCFCFEMVIHFLPNLK